MAESAAATSFLASVLRSDAHRPDPATISPEQCLRTCREEGLIGLVAERIALLPTEGEWEHVRRILLRERRERTAQELLRAKELTDVLDALGAEGVAPIVFKGTSLAFSLYEHPASRPRLDTDLMIRKEHVGTVRGIMTRRGYSIPLYCEGDLLFCQFPLKKTDAFGVRHALDVHWKISTQSLFADMLTYDDMDAEARSLPGLGPHARTTSLVHALLLSCVHPVMHHRNAESLLWLYDIHLLASRLSEEEFSRFTDLARAKRVAGICASQLDTARRHFGTVLPPSTSSTLGEPHTREPTSAYLEPHRHYRHELLANIRGLPRWRDRVRYLREVMFPEPSYMLASYGRQETRFGIAALPLLYLHRLASGGLRTVRGRK